MAYSKNSVTLKFSQADMNKIKTSFERFGKSVEKSKQGEKLFDKALARAVGPWQRAVNGGKVYRFIKKQTGMSKDPFGNTKIKGTRAGVYGRRVGPKKRGKKNAGWRIHFFASPAKHIRKGKKIPFRGYFRQRNAAVVSKLRSEIKNLLLQLAEIHITK